MNPLFAKLTPALLESMATDGMVISISEPTAMDSWTQFLERRTNGNTCVLFAGIMAMI